MTDDPTDTLGPNGRTVEIAALHQALVAASGGSGHLVVVTGEAGVGKSWLLGEVGAAARARGMPVLTGRSTEDSGAYRPIAEALLRLPSSVDPDSVPELRPYRGALGRLLPGWASRVHEPEPSVDPVLVLGEGVARLLGHVARDTGCLMLVEDLHWADADTLALLQYLAVALGDVAALIVASARDDEPGSAVATCLGRAPGVISLPIARLPRAAIAAIVRARAGDKLSPETLEAVVDSADGLPLLVEELVDAALRFNPERSVPDVPPTLNVLVRRRLATLSPTQQRSLGAAAVCSPDPDWGLLAEVLDQPEDEVIATARAATEAHLLEDAGGVVRWRHALVRDAVLSTLLPPERKAHARRAGRALLARGRPDDAVRGAELLAEGGDEDRAAATFVALAGRERVHGALRQAGRLLDRAEAVGAGGIALATERVAVLTLTGRVTEALAVGDSALAFASGSEHAELCLRLARCAVMGGRWTDATAYLDRAGRPDDPRSLVLAADAAFGGGDVDRAAALAVRAVEQSEALGSPPDLCEALDITARVRRLSDAATAKVAFARAAQVAAEHRLATQRVAALLGLGTLELLESESSESLPKARELAMEAGLLAQACAADVILLDSVFAKEGPRAAEAPARDLVERGTLLRVAQVREAGLLHVALARAAEGDVPGMETALEGLAGEDQAPEGAALEPAVRAFHLLLARDLAGASELFDAGLARLVEHRVAAPLHEFGLWVLLRTVVDDRGEEAQEILRSLPAVRRPANRGALRYAEAVSAGRAGRRKAAEALLVAGDADLVALPWLHRLLRWLVLEAAVSAGWGDPVPVLRADLAEHERYGDHQLARSCRDLLRRAGAPTRRGRGTTPVPPALRAAGVTTREMDVLALLSTGLTNAEIAARLHLSPRTVETHVANLLAKLDATNRTELIRRTTAQYP